MQQFIETVNKPIQAVITIPGSKSITNRALLLAAFADGTSELSDILLSDDTWVFIKALQELGCQIVVNELTRSCTITGVGGVFPKKKAAIACGDAGTAARFLLAACASTAGSYQFDGSMQLRSRPIKPLLRILASQGVKMTPKEATAMPFIIKGCDGLVGGEVIVDGSLTGQFISALLMVAPLAKSSMIIQAENLVSEPYIDMTSSMMGEFGVLVKRLHQGRYHIPVPQRYRARDYVIEPDLSTASYFFAAAAVTAGEITIQAIDRDSSKQADVQFLKVLEKMGCIVNAVSTGLTVKGPQQLQGLNVDMRNFSDTFMTLAAIAPFANSPTTITNISHARLKESDRITVMQTELEKLKVKVESGNDWIRIYPCQPQGGVIQSHNDHRIAMAFAILGLRVPDLIIDDAECVSKTCPDFFSLMENFYRNE